MSQQNRPLHLLSRYERLWTLCIFVFPWGEAMAGPPVSGETLRLRCLGSGFTAGWAQTWSNAESGEIRSRRMLCYAIRMNKRYVVICALWWFISEVFPAHFLINDRIGQLPIDVECAADCGISPNLGLAFITFSLYIQFLLVATWTIHNFRLTNRQKPIWNKLTTIFLATWVVLFSCCFTIYGPPLLFFSSWRSS